MSFTVNGTNFPLTTGTYTASFPAAFDDVASNYHLIAVSDADSSDSTVEFAGGIFVAASVTASPPQNILYVFGSNASDVPTSGGDTVNIYGPTDSNPNTVVFDNGAPFSIGSDHHRDSRSGRGWKRQLRKPPPTSPCHSGSMAATALIRSPAVGK